MIVFKVVVAAASVIPNNTMFTNLCQMRFDTEVTARAGCLCNIWIGFNFWKEQPISFYLLIKFFYFFKF